MKKIMSIVMTALVFLSGATHSVFAELPVKQKRSEKVQKTEGTKKEMRKKSGKIDQLEKSADQDKLKKQTKNIKFDNLETKDWKR
ncbi:MAG TPA: hypothetical protein PKL97_02850 [Candidatus Omnitrophota bacterium]|nr:hypothetical protein [Candidatus Omnitrophota bacterium]